MFHSLVRVSASYAKMPCVLVPPHAWMVKQFFHKWCCSSIDARIAKFRRRRMSSGEIFQWGHLWFGAGWYALSTFTWTQQTLRNRFYALGFYNPFQGTRVYYSCPESNIAGSAACPPLSNDDEKQVRFCVNCQVALQLIHNCLLYIIHMLSKASNFALVTTEFAHATGRLHLEATSCKQGQYLQAGACSNCLAGYYCATYLSQVPCSSGKYSSLGSTACTNCPSGRYSTSTGQTSIATCTNCTMGSYSTMGSSACTSCPAGM